MTLTGTMLRTSDRLGGRLRGGEWHYALPLLRAIDRPGVRFILSKMATWHARRRSPSIRVFFDRVWMHEVDGRFWADSEKFSYHGNCRRTWQTQGTTVPYAAADNWFYLYKPRLGDVIVDIGAGNGMEILTFSQPVGETGRVIAVEAHPGTFSMLERVCHWNKLNNVTCHMKAVMAEVGTAFITDDVRDSGHHNQLAEDGIAVSGTTVDELTADFPVIDFVKMNNEGAERIAIEGMSESIKKTRYVCVAAHDFRAERGDGEQFRTRKVVIEFLRDHGFEVKTRESANPESNATWESVQDHVHGWLPTHPGNHPLDQQPTNR